jgi:hypothetical protein
VRFLPQVRPGVAQPGALAEPVLPVVARAPVLPGAALAERVVVARPVEQVLLVVALAELAARPEVPAVPEHLSPVVRPSRAEHPPVLRSRMPRALRAASRLE